MMLMNDLLARSFGVPLVLAALLLSACERETKPAETPDDEAQSEVPEEETITEKEDPVELIEPSDLGPAAPAIYFTSGLKGYTEPCGCTADVLLGGIDRIVAFVEDSRKLHPAAVMIDAGDWLLEYDTIEPHMEPQERAKAEVLAAAHKSMGTRFSVPGPRDLALGPEFYLEMMAKGDVAPLSANLILKGTTPKATEVVELGDWTVGFVGLDRKSVV